MKSFAALTRNTVVVAAAIALCGVALADAQGSSNTTATAAKAHKLHAVIRHASGPHVSGPIGTIASITVSCHANEIATGGGGTPADGNWAMLLSQPENAVGATSGSPVKWRVDYGNYNDISGAGTIPNAYVVCEHR